MSPRIYNENNKQNNTKGKNEKDSFSGLPVWRIKFIAFIAFIFCFSVIVRLFFLQVKAYSFYRSLADDQHLENSEILPKRGEIFLQEKDLLFPVAVNRDLPTAYLVPREIDQAKILDLSEKISRILSLEKNEVFEKISKKDDVYELLKKRISKDEATQMAEIKEKGVYLMPESWRYYPGENLASSVIGFVGYKDENVEGIYGLEKYFEEKLKGTKGFLKQERDAGGRWISVGEKELYPSKDGDNLILTIDHIIQFKAEMALRNAVKKHNADGGRVLIMNPYDGKIIAMAQEPSFNINKYSEVDDLGLFRNTLISDTYECGSIFKTITMAAGIDSGKVEYDETFEDTGQVREAGFLIENSDGKAYGKQTMTEILEKSLNTGAIYVEKKVGNETFKEYVKKFGFGELSNVELPSETRGNISNLETNRNIEYFTASFGQGITVTPLQILNAYGAIANGGELLKPQIIDYIENAKGEIEKRERELRRKVISKDTANKISLMLESNVKNGHGKHAGVPGYRIGGKTGTAQISDKKVGGYEEGKTVGSFAGYGPIENPKFVMLVVIDNPKDVEWAESTAAPVFGELARFILDYWGIDTTEEYTEQDLIKFNETHNYINYQQEDDLEDEKKSEKDKENKDDTKELN